MIKMNVLQRLILVNLRPELGLSLVNVTPGWQAHTPLLAAGWLTANLLQSLNSTGHNTQILFAGGLGKQN